MNDESQKRKTPKPAGDQDAPAPVRPTTPQEEKDQDVEQLSDPPQAEGDRESARE